MEEAGDLLEDSWFFGKLLHTETTTISRSYSDLASTSCPPLHPNPPLCLTREHMKNQIKDLSFSSRKQPLVAPTSLTRMSSLPTSIETKSSPVKKPDPSHSLMPFIVESDKKDANINNERKTSSLSSRKQPPIEPPSLQTLSLSNPTETQSFLSNKPNLIPNLTRTSSLSASVGGSDQEDEDDQESEFTLGRLIRQASMNSSHTSNPPRQTWKAMTENMQSKPEFDQEKISVMRKMERNRSKNTKNGGNNKIIGGTPAIPGRWIEKSSSEDMKAHIKFWARAVASNVRQECS